MMILDFCSEKQFSGEREIIQEEEEQKPDHQVAQQPDVRENGDSGKSPLQDPLASQESQENAEAHQRTDRIEMGPPFEEPETDPNSYQVPITSDEPQKENAPETPAVTQEGNHPSTSADVNGQTPPPLVLKVHRHNGTYATTSP